VEPVEKTALAEAEVEYEDIVSTQIDVGFEIVESRSRTGRRPCGDLDDHALDDPGQSAIAYGPRLIISGPAFA